MKVVLSYSRKDYNLAWYAIKVLLKHTDVPRDKLVLYGSEFAPQVPKDIENENIELMRSARDADKYPLGPNAMFAGLVSHIADWNEPVFMCEPDGFPTCRDWYRKVRDAHVATNKLASGSWIDWVKPKHLNGNMVIEPYISEIHPCLGRVTYEAWDVFHAEFLAKYGGINHEILNPRRVTVLNHTGFWLKQRLPSGHRPAWIHGCQNFQMWEYINKEGFGDDGYLV